MTKEHGIPDRRIPRAENPAPQSSGLPETSPVKPRPHGAATAPPKRDVSQQVDQKPVKQRTVTRSESRLKTSIGTVTQTVQNALFKDWRGLIAISIVLTGGITVFSAAFLLKLPAVPNCPSIFWPLASASLRLHCAQLAANKRTVNDLLEAITLVNSLPPNHPLYEEVQRQIGLWAQDILDIGEESFQAGKLDDAISAARRVPKNVIAQKEVEERIKRWQEIWTSAEAVYRKAEDALRDQDWRLASNESSRLLSVENAFWQTTKYQELTELITSTREDINKLAKAKDLIEAGGLKNFQEALKLVTSISDKSYVYPDTQKTIVDLGQKMLYLAENLLDRKDLGTALDIVRQIPPNANLKREIEDFEVFSNARAKVWNGIPEDYDAAIADLKKIGPDRPFYHKAQDWIARWQTEKTDIAQLNKARQLAQTGRPQDLQAAITIASKIPPSNPKGEEASAFLNEITAGIQAKEDQPILDRADQLALQGDINSLQAAIAALDNIPPGRALSEEVTRKRQQYRDQLQQLRRQEADLLAPEPPAPAVDPDVAKRESERNQADMSLQAARETANLGTVDALAEAIQQADGVGAASPYRREAQQLMDTWSQQIFQASVSQAASDVSGAIATAQKIPPGTAAFPQAQRQIQFWRRRLGR